MSYRPNIIPCFVIGFSLFMAACQTKQAKSIHPVKQQFHAQVSSSCAKGKMSLSKTVSTLGSAESTEETQLIASLTSEDGTCYLDEELTYAMEIYHASEKVKELFTIQQKQDTTMAVVLPQYANTTRLQAQRIVLSADKQTILWVESVIQKSHWLYDTKVKIAVSFNEKGDYMSHQSDIFMDVTSVSDSISSHIEGKRVLFQK